MFKPGYPRSYTDEDLQNIVEQASGAFIFAAAGPHLNDVLKMGEVLDLAHGEIQRRALRESGRQATWALRFAAASTFLATIVGIAQIVIAVR
jgi:hypothetical protein